MSAIVIAYLILLVVHVVVDFVACIISRSPFKPVTMVLMAIAWPVTWPLMIIMAAVLLRGLKDAGLVPETKSAGGHL